MFSKPSFPGLSILGDSRPSTQLVGIILGVALVVEMPDARVTPSGRYDGIGVMAVSLGGVWAAAGFRRVIPHAMMVASCL